MLSKSRWIFLLFAMLIAMLVYLPGLYGDYEFDDGVNILDNAALKVSTLSYESILAAATSGKSGVLGRSISMLSFAGNYYLTGFDPFFFKFTNLLIHVFAGIGVYVLVYQLALVLDKGEDLTGEDRSGLVERSRRDANIAVGEEVLLDDRLERRFGVAPGVHADQGSITSSPAASNGEASREATAYPCDAATAAM